MKGKLIYWWLKFTVISENLSLNIELSALFAFNLYKFIVNISVDMADIQSSYIITFLVSSSWNSTNSSNISGFLVYLHI